MFGREARLTCSLRLAGGSIMLVPKGIPKILGKRPIRLRSGQA